MLFTHIDPTPPLETIRKVYEMLTAGTWKSLQFVGNVCYLIAWAFDFLSRKTEPDKPIFGTQPGEAEFCQFCVSIHDWATDGDVAVQRSAIGAWLVKAALLALLNRLIAEIAKNGLPDWIADLVKELKDELEAL